MKIKEIVFCKRLRNALLWKINYLNIQFMESSTLKKIAESLGLSISTVSRALKNHPDISANTRQRVVDLAKALDYEPNANAVHLRTKNSKLLGVLVPSISNYFYESFISSIEEEGRKIGYSVLILQSGNDPEVESENLKLFRQNRIKGLFACISSKTKDFSGFEKMDDPKTPIIFFDNIPNLTAIHSVCFADTQAGIMAAETIILKKKRNIWAIFGDNQLSITQKRMRSFLATFQKLAPTIQVQTLFALSSEEARNQTNHLLLSPNQPDTIFCMSDEILMGVMKSLQENKISIPAQMAVIAISNGLIPKLYYPEITYVETSGYKLGKLAFVNMISCLSENTLQSEIILESVLVEGGSL